MKYRLKLAISLSLGMLLVSHAQAQETTKTTLPQDQCQAIYSTSDQTLTIPCVTANMQGQTINYRLILKQSGSDVDSFSLIDMKSSGLANNSKCIAGYSFDTGYLNIPCVENSNSLSLYANNLDYPFSFTVEQTDNNRRQLRAACNVPSTTYLQVQNNPDCRALWNYVVYLRTGSRVIFDRAQTISNKINKVDGNVESLQDKIAIIDSLLALGLSSKKMATLTFEAQKWALKKMIPEDMYGKEYVEAYADLILSGIQTAAENVGEAISPKDAVLGALPKLSSIATSVLGSYTQDTLTEMNNELMIVHAILMDYYKQGSTLESLAKYYNISFQEGNFGEQFYTDIINAAAKRNGYENWIFGDDYNIAPIFADLRHMVTVVMPPLVDACLNGKCDVREISRFEGSVSLLDGSKNCNGCNTDSMIINPNKDQTGESLPSTIAVYWLYNQENCHHIDVSTDRDIGQIIYKAKFWSDNLTKKAYKSTLPTSIEKFLSSTNLGVIAISTERPIVEPTKITVSCRKKSDALKGKKTDVFSSNYEKNLVALEHGYYWTGNGAIIPTLGSRTSDNAPTFQQHKSLTSFHWIPNDMCASLRISDDNSKHAYIELDGFYNEVAYKERDAKSWKTMSCTSLPCDVTLDASERSKIANNVSYIVKVKTDPGKVPSRKLRASCR